MASKGSTAQVKRLRSELAAIILGQQHESRQASEAIGDATDRLHQTAQHVRAASHELRDQAVDYAQALTRYRHLAPSAVAMVSAAGLAGLLRRRRQRHRPRRAAEPHRPVATPRPAPALVAPPPVALRPLAAPGGATPPEALTGVTRNFLLGFVMPVWLIAGIADWVCHRRAHIERNSGRPESLMHLLMLGEAALPVICGLLLEITSPVLLLMAGAVVAHGATALWDVSYAVKRRQVTPIEQHVHSYLEMVPVMALGFVAVLHWPELRALLGRGDRAPDWSIRRKRVPLPAATVTALLVAMATLEVGPYLEELWRTQRTRQRALL